MVGMTAFTCQSLFFLVDTVLMSNRTVPDGHFLDGIFPDGQFPEDISRTSSSPMDSSQNGQFPERTFSRITISFKSKKVIDLN